MPLTLQRICRTAATRSQPSSHKFDNQQRIPSPECKAPLGPLSLENSDSGQGVGSPLGRRSFLPTANTTDERHDDGCSCRNPRINRHLSEKGCMIFRHSHPSNCQSLPRWLAHSRFKPLPQSSSGGTFSQDMTFPALIRGSHSYNSSRIRMWPCRNGRIPWEYVA